MRFLGGGLMLRACAALLDASGETLQITATDPKMTFRYWLNPAALGTLNPTA